MSPKRVVVRKGATRVEVFNSGLEVWLYDDANRETIHKKNLTRKLIEGGATDGRLVGYSLRQDDSLNIDVVVGSPLTRQELARGRFLEPQTAFLRLPSGRLAVESNDSCRVGEEETTDRGALLSLPAGDYLLTLYRVDHEALGREGISWTGAWELVVLTASGTKRDDARGLLPFVPRRDTSFVGRIAVTGSKARGLVWFDDYRSTYHANIDSGTAGRMGLRFGSYFRATVPALNLALVTVFAPSWREGSRLPPPDGERPPEFGFGAITKPGEWGGAEVLLCRRVSATTDIDDAHRKVWLDATFEVLDLLPRGPAERIRGPLLHDGARPYWRSSLAGRPYFAEAPNALSGKLQTRLADVSFDVPLSLPEAITRIDGAFSTLGFKPLGDFAFDLGGPDAPVEFTVRAYHGTTDTFGAVWASEDAFEVFLFSRVGSSWVLTGTIAADAAVRISAAYPRISMVGADHTRVGDLMLPHREHVERTPGSADRIPASLEEIVPLYDDYLSIVTGPPENR